MSKVLIFLSGAAIGSVITFYVTKKMVSEAAQKRADEEIESVKIAFKKLEEEDKKKRELQNDADVAIEEYKGDSEETTEPQKKPDEETVIIRPEDYANDTGFSNISLVYYAQNKKLCYLSGGVVEYPEDLFDIEFLNRFGEFEENMLYVRNIKEKIDYDVEWLDQKYTGV